MVSVSTFSDLGLHADFVSHLQAIGFNEPTDIQKSAIPELLGEERDFIGMASTGTGKTGAFAIPLIEKIQLDLKKPQALVLCPTRELALQVSGQIQKMSDYKRIKTALIYGGSSYQTQIRALKQGAQIVVATPGRLVDLLEQNILSLATVRTLVLDEADEMLSLGFKEALDFILKAMKNLEHPHRVWLFSATMSTEIQRLTERYLKNPLIVKKTSGRQVTEDIQQSYILVNEKDKLEVLKRIMLKQDEFYGLIFCQRREEASELSNFLVKSGIPSDSLHGEKTQKDRERILGLFRKRQVHALVATDVAARGIDVKDLTHVVNWSLPWEVESYIHRIGRTGRNGQKGLAVSLVNPAQMSILRRIEKVTRQTIVQEKPPSSDELQKHLMTKMLDTFERALAHERIGKKINELAEKLELPESYRKLSAEKLFALFASQYEPDFFRQTPISEPVPERDRGGNRRARPRFRRRR